MRITLTELRNGAKLTQRELAKGLTAAGVRCSPASIALYELGKRSPSLERARAIATYFGVSVDDLDFGPVACETQARYGDEQAATLEPTGTEGGSR